MIIAALDIGSNSIHLVVAETDHVKPFRVVASAKDVVRLGRSSARDQRLSAAAMDRAIDCLKRFRRVAESHGARELIAVATSAVREASNRDQFLSRVAEDAGIDIDMLSGIEEARLIALAVSVRYRQSLRRRAIVIDIGGGSTELAVMKNGEPTTLVSFKLGAVRLTEQYVKSAPVGEKQLRRLRSELREMIAHRASEIEAAGFDAYYGTSGTINALAALSLRRRLAAGGGRMARRRPEHSLTLDELRALNEELASYTLEERIQVAHLNRQRAEIVVAGGLPRSKREYYSDLRAQDREVVRKLAALLRLADALDRDHEGSVRGLRCEIGDGEVRIVALCSREADTMRWRLEERADLFADVFGREVELVTMLNAADYEELAL